MISRAAVSLIIRTGGAERPFRHDLHFSEGSRFPYDALAAFVGVIIVIIYWLGRA